MFEKVLDDFLKRLSVFLIFRPNEREKADSVGHGLKEHHFFLLIDLRG